MPCATMASWAPLISACMQSGQSCKALPSHMHVLGAGVKPDFYTFINLIKVCGNNRDLEFGSKVHSDVVERGLDVDDYLGSTLVSMYGKCKSLFEAEFVFGRLMQHDVISWNAMLSAYLDGNREEKTLQLYRQMQQEGVTPNHLTYVFLFRACAILGDERGCPHETDEFQRRASFLEIGRTLHADARRNCLMSDPYIESALLSMYKRCNSIKEVEAMFVGLSACTVVSWNVMLSAYTEQGHEERALQLFGKMQKDGVSPDPQTLMIAFQCCRGLAGNEEATSAERLVAYKVCLALHTDASSRGLDSDIILGSMLICIYGKCGNIAEAEIVFGGLQKPDIAAWNALLSAYVEQFQEENVFRLYRQMQEEGVCEDEITLVAVLQACRTCAVKGEATMISLAIGTTVHSVAQKKGLESSNHVGNSLINLYGKCGDIEHAELAFTRISLPDLVSWNAMSYAYAEQGQYDRALQFYCKMQREGVVPDKRTFMTALQVCIMARDEEKALVDHGRRTVGRVPVEIGRAIHIDIQVKGHDSDLGLQSSIMNMYHKSGALMEAECMFFGIHEKDNVSWNVLLAAYVEHGQGQTALQVFKLMQEQSVHAGEHSLVTALKACISLLENEQAVLDEHMTVANCLEIGQSLHSYGRKNGLSSNVFIGSALISMYSKCRVLALSEHVFAGFPKKNVILWNTILSAYVEHGDGGKALQLYSEMKMEGAEPDQQTVTTALQACCMLAEKEEAIIMAGQRIKLLPLRIGQALHTEAAQSHMYTMDAFLASTLVSMYAKCGVLREGESIFLQLPKKNTASLNAMLSAYVDSNQWEKALNLYSNMLKVHTVSISDFTLVNVLQACRQSGCGEMCKQVHSTMVAAGVHVSALLVTTILHAYGSCGNMRDAEAVFEALTCPDVAAWSACITGFGWQGESEASFYLLEEMLMGGINADLVMYTSIFSTCSHAGLVDEGNKSFECMIRDYGLVPSLKHYGSMIDLVGRAGNLKRVRLMLKNMPGTADVAIWLSVLNACCVHGDWELAKLAFSSALHLESPGLVSCQRTSCVMVL